MIFIFFLFFNNSHTQCKKTALFINQKQFVCLFFVSNFPIKLSYSLYYAKACNKFVGPILTALRLLGKTALFEEMPQKWQAIGNTVSDLTGPRFER